MSLKVGRVLRLLRGNRSGLLLPRRALSYPNEPLTQAIDVGAAASRDPTAAQPSVSPHSSETRVTKLDNGLRVASQEAFGQYSTIGGETRAVEPSCSQGIVSTVERPREDVP